MLARWAGSPRPHSSGKCCSLSTLGHPHDEEPGQTVSLKVRLASVALDQVQTHKPYTVTFDLADPGAIAGAASEILQCFGHVDVLINNAGISYRGAIVDTSPDVDKRVMETNYFGPVALTKGKFLGQKGEVPGQVGIVFISCGSFFLDLLSYPLHPGVSAVLATRGWLFWAWACAVLLPPYPSTVFGDLPGTGGARQRHSDILPRFSQQCTGG